MNLLPTDLNICIFEYLDREELIKMIKTIPKYKNKKLLDSYLEKRIFKDFPKYESVDIKVIYKGLRGSGLSNFMIYSIFNHLYTKKYKIDLELILEFALINLHQYYVVRVVDFLIEHTYNKIEFNYLQMVKKLEQYDLLQYFLRYSTKLNCLLNSSLVEDSRLWIQLYTRTCNYKSISASIIN